MYKMLEYNAVHMVVLVIILNVHRHGTALL